MTACAREASPQSPACRRFRSPSPRGEKIGSRRSVDDEVLALETPCLPGKPSCAAECSTACSTACPSALSTGGFESPDRPAGESRGAKNANFKLSGSSAPLGGSFAGLRQFFAAGPFADVTLKDVSATESPRTPRTSREHASLHPTPPCAPVHAPPPELLKALNQRCLEAVRLTLESDPEAAQEPFWEHNVEPPLCSAVRLMCCPEIISLLLEHGASVDQRDMYNQTPLMLLHSAGVRRQLDTCPDWSQIEQLLLDAGADVSSVLEQVASPRGPLIGPNPSVDWDGGLPPPMPEAWLAQMVPLLMPVHFDHMWMEDDGNEESSTSLR